MSNSATSSELTKAPRVLLFGGAGAIGSSLLEKFLAEGWQVIATGRHAPTAPVADGVTWLELDPFAENFDGSALDKYGQFSAVCWAQGANINDSAYDVDTQQHMELYRANCLFVVITLQKLLSRKLLSDSSRLCVISSIWQNIARQNKYSYCITKAALQGLVLSAAADLASDGHLINAVLPGALDTPMTQRNLSPDQIKQLETATKFNRMPKLNDVSNLVFHLCSPNNTGITGQFIASDLGYSHVRII
ncbi:MAG: SDR family oxidoreductase [Alphaproteobacteria bacterium]|nr:SDR family oxidoreductase [Alphaproteobacteria bacterium]